MFRESLHRKITSSITAQGVSRTPCREYLEENMGKPALVLALLFCSTTIAQTTHRVSLSACLLRDSGWLPPIRARVEWICSGERRGICVHTLLIRHSAVQRRRALSLLHEYRAYLCRVFVMSLRIAFSTLSFSESGACSRAEVVANCCKFLSQS